MARSLLDLIYLDIWVYSDLTNEMGKLLLQIYQRNNSLEEHIEEFRNELAKHISTLNCFSLTGISGLKIFSNENRVVLTCYHERRSLNFLQILSQCRNR